MFANYHQINDPFELELHLLCIAYLYGDYSIPYHFINPNSHAYLAVKKNDIAALQMFASRNWVDSDLLSEEKSAELDNIYKVLNEKYGNQLRAQQVPLPDTFLSDLGVRAIELGHYRDAHSAFKACNQLDKYVNQFLNETIQLLQSKQLRSGEGEQSDFEEKVAAAVEMLFKALKLKNPFGNQFQKLALTLHYEDAEAMRKYSKYIDQNLFKEILDFGIQYLIDDKNLFNRIEGFLSSGKLRRSFYKQLAVRFSGGITRFNDFVQNYKNAVQQLSSAKSEQDFLQVQRTLLGRGTGDNKYFQFLQELALEHPVSALLVITEKTPEQQNFIAPLMLKPELSLLDFLEIA